MVTLKLNNPSIEPIVKVWDVTDETVLERFKNFEQLLSPGTLGKIQRFIKKIKLETDDDMDLQKLSLLTSADLLQIVKQGRVDFDITGPALLTLDKITTRDQKLDLIKEIVENKYHIRL